MIVFSELLLSECGDRARLAAVAAAKFLAVGEERGCGMPRPSYECVGSTEGREGGARPPLLRRDPSTAETSLLRDCVLRDADADLREEPSSEL